LTLRLRDHSIGANGSAGVQADSAVTQALLVVEFASCPPY